MNHHQKFEICIINSYKDTHSIAFLFTLCTNVQLFTVQILFAQTSMACNKYQENFDLPRTSFILSGSGTYQYQYSSTCITVVTFPYRCPFKNVCVCVCIFFFF